PEEIGSLSQEILWIRSRARAQWLRHQQDQWPANPGSAMINRSDNEPGCEHGSRRAFLAATAGTALATIVPRHVLGGAGCVPPSERINLAGIGAGGMGGGDIATLAKLGVNIVALCDVDEERAAGSYKAFPKAKRYKDFREMLDKEAQHIDAVSVGTPD